MNASPLEPWIQRIKTILHFHAWQPPTNPWLLIPFEHDELSEHETVQLFKALRNFLFRHRGGTDLQKLITSLRSLTADERLVFLYTLRVVATNGASNNRYWTLCHEQLFDRRITLDELRLRLASDITDQWLRLYHASDGALFFPQTGKRHIKWALAHAGLLQRHKEELRTFRHSIRATWSDAEFVLLVHPDNFDDFRLELDQWFRSKPYQSDLEMLVTNKDCDIILLELSRQYLAGLPDAISEPEIEQLPTTTPLRRVTRRLRYNMTEQRLEWHVTLHFNLPQGRLHIEWDGAPRRFKTPNSNCDYEIDLPLRKPTWQTQLQVYGDDIRYDLTLPAPFGSMPLVFAPLTGQRLRTWALGHTYLVLLPNEGADNNQFVKLLAEPLVEEQILKGDWHTYSLVQIHLRVPDPALPFSHLNQIAAELGLPLFEPYGKPTITLVGGLQLHASELPTFLAEKPPLIKLTGIWNNDLTLECRTSYDHDGEHILRITLPAQPIWTTQYFECPPTIHARYYSVGIVGQTPIQWNTTATCSSLPSTTISAQLDVIYANTVQTFVTTEILANSMARIQAWAFADVMLLAQAGDLLIRIPLTLDADGTATLAMGETAIIEHGHRQWTLWLTWHNVPISNRIRCHLVQTLDPERVEVAADERSVEVLVQMPEHQPSTRIQACVLDAYPWRTQIQSRVARIQQGLLHLQFDGNPLSMQWLLLFEQRQHQAPQFLSIYNLLPDRKHGFRQPELTNNWLRFLPLIEQHTLPEPLQHMVAASRTRIVWNALRREMPRDAYWLDINTPQRISVVEAFERVNLSVPLALCECEPDTGYHPMSHMLTVASLDVYRRSYHVLEQPIDVTRRLAHGRHSAMNASLYWEDDEGEYKLCLASKQHLYVCHACRLILETSYEHPHLSKCEQCSERAVGLFRARRVYLYAFVDARMIFEQFFRALEGLTNGRTVAPMWLEWLDDLYDVMAKSGFDNELTWLKGLVRAYDALRTNQFDVLSHEDGILIVTYAEALKHVCQKIKELIHV